jgi:hypothetical protein
MRGAQPASGSPVEFLIDDEDRVIAVNREFVRFANENDWQISRADVLGTTLWDHIDGRQVAALNRMLISSARSGGRTITLPMRCDSPTRKRLLDVSLTPRFGGQVALSANPRQHARRPYQPLFVPSTCNGPGEIAACSWCARFAPAGDWIEAEEAAELIGIPRGTPAPRLKYTVCRRCGDLLSGAMA